MTQSKDSTQNAPKSRQESLRAHRQHSQENIPTFFKNQKEVNSNNTQTSAQPSNQLVFNMHKTSIFGFLLTIALVVVLVFAAGFLLGYSMTSTPSQESTEVLKIAETPQPKPDTTPKATSIPSQEIQEVAEPLQEPATNLVAEETTKTEAPVIESLESVLEEIEEEEALIPAEELVIKDLESSEFAIEFGVSDEEVTANDMSQELQKQGIKTSVTQGIDDDGRMVYYIRGGKYDDYDNLIHPEIHYEASIEHFCVSYFLFTALLIGCPVT